MCDFLSGLISSDGKTVYVRDLRHHEKTAEICALKPEQYREWEWTGSGEESLRVRVHESSTHNENYYRASILGRWQTRESLLGWLFTDAKFCDWVSGVGGYLDLDGCTGLTSLPDGLSVGGNLYLGDCTGLTALPDGLSVGGYLDLRGCTGLTAMPECLGVGGNIYPPEHLKRCQAGK